MSVSTSKEFSPRCADVGSVIEYFESPNSVTIQSGEKFVKFNPVEEGIFYTNELSQGYEHAYFFIKFFSSIDPEIVPLNPTDGGYVQFQITPDLPNFGVERWRDISNGVFYTRLTDQAERQPPTTSGPLKKARVVLGNGLPTGANYFIAWVVQF